MKVIVNNSCLVQPAEPTWNGRMPLTESDQIGIVTHVQLNYFYKDCPTQELDTIFTILKSCLGKVLVLFYPLAGRLRWLNGSRLELDCNGKGVQFIEASCVDSTLEDFGDFATSPHVHYLIPQINYRDPIEEIPLLLVQLTKFTCGGIVLHVSLSHAIADGQSGLHFLSEWARLARGEPLGTPPFIDGKVLRAGEDVPFTVGESNNSFKPDYAKSPPLLIGQTSSESERKKVTEIAMLKLSKIQVEMLKNEANNNHSNGHNNGEINCNNVRAYTRYESIVGHIWRSLCKASSHVHEQPTTVGLYVDIRNRMEPPLPNKFFGNGIEIVDASGISGDIVTKPLGYAAGRIRHAVDKVTNEYVNSAIDFWKNMKDLSGHQDIHIRSGLLEGPPPFCGNPNFEVVSWMWLPLYGLDFGWGKEIYMAPVMINYSDGESLILRDYDEVGGLVVALRLQSECMADFKKFFYRDIQTLVTDKIA